MAAKPVTTGASESSAEHDNTQPEAEKQATSDGTITIYPVRSYLDGKEIKRAGGEGYKSPKHEATQLIAKGLATDKKPKA